MHSEVIIVCPKCNVEMKCYGVTTKDTLGNDVHIFECPNCLKIQEAILK